MASEKMLNYGLCAIAILVVLYICYTYFYSDGGSDDSDSDEEEFDNNSSVRSDYGADVDFDDLPLLDKIRYLTDKQNKLLVNSQYNQRTIGY